MMRQSKLPLLPPSTNNKKILTSEQEMLQDRYRTYVEYLVIDDKGKLDASHSDRVDIDNRCQEVQNMKGKFIVTRVYIDHY